MAAGPNTHLGMDLELLQFLQTVVTTPQGWLRLYTRSDGVESWVQWPLLPDALSPILVDAVDVYFSPHLYATPSSTSPILPTYTLALDIGQANLLYLPLAPTVIVQTSPLRKQAYWVFSTLVDQEMQNQLALSITGVDPSSAPQGYLLRLPNTTTSKYVTPFRVHLAPQPDSTGSIYDASTLIPNPNNHTLAPLPTTLPPPVLDGKPPLDPLKPYQYMRSLVLSPETQAVYDKHSSAPAEVLRVLARELLTRKPPLPLGNILYVLKHSANNVFEHLAYHQDEELLKFVLEVQHTAHIPDAHTLIARVRQTSTNPDERHENIGKIVRETMLLQGTFIHTHEGGLWYVPHHGETIAIGQRSDSLQAFLQNSYGLNETDVDTAFTTGQLTAFVYSLPKRAYETKLSYYDPHAKRLLLHTGTDLVWSITPTSIQQVPNGSHGVVLFPLKDIFIPFVPRPVPPDPTLPHWSETLFGPFLDNITNLDHEEARAIMTAWLLFLFFRNSAPSRPILALFGVPGSGKSTTLKRVCTFLYGKTSGFSGITTPQDFDHASGAVPLAVFDNVDTWEKWLPDRLAQSAGVLETPVRKYYTNTGTVILRRDALIAISAHDPKFGRADIADRLLILNMRRSTSFIKEAALLSLPRPQLWYQVIQDLQLILQTPQPEIPEQLRIEDFAALGSWITSPLGLLPHFRSALTKLRGGQRGFAIEGEQLLVDAIISYLEKHPATGEFKPLTSLYGELEWASKDGPAFLKRYKNAQILSKRLSTMQEALRAIVDIDIMKDSYGRELWRLQPKEKEDTSGPTTD